MEFSTIILFLFLLSLSAFFSGTEVALMSLQWHKIESLVKEGKFGANILRTLKKNVDKLLITILIGNTFAITITSSIATNSAIHIAESSWTWESIAVVIATILSTFFILLFWEIIPKSYGAKNPEKLGLLAAYPYKVLLIVFFPIIIVFETIIKLFTWKVHKTHISDEELESFIDMGKDSGTIDEAEHEKLLGVLELDNLTAQDIMTHRIDIYGLEENITVNKSIEDYIENAHSRIPVYKDSIDKIHSYITIHDLVLAQAKGQGNKKLCEITLHKVLKIPWNQPLDRLLELLQKNNKHLAIIIDEYGWVAWLITLEDIIEEVFWDIRDETDTEIDGIKKVSEYNYLIDATVMIDEVLEEVDLELYHIGLDVREFSSETVSYILTDKLERFPHTGEVIDFPIVVKDERSSKFLSVDFKIIEISEGKIGRIEVKMNLTEAKGA